MTEDGGDRLEALLSALAVDAPGQVWGRVAARWVRVPGPVGDVFVAFTDLGIAYACTAESVGESASDFAAACRHRLARPLVPADRPPAGLRPALRSGRGAGLRFDLRGTSAFDQSVLRTALTIPRGEVRPYGWVAREIGRPAAVRAVGSALARNPVPVLIPCHRVIRLDGAIGGYVFGAETKRRLLHAEGANVEEVRDLARRGVHFVGSDTTGVVCLPGCPHARRILPRCRRLFRSAAEARTAGFRPCRHCRPMPPAADGGHAPPS